MNCRLYEQKALRAVTGRTIRPGGFELTDRAVEFCRFPQDTAIADIGCGSGATVERLRGRFGLRAVGVDLSAKLLSEGRQCPELPLAQARGEALPFGTGRLDAVICECVISLVPAPAKVLSECRRVLKAGGYLIVSDLYHRDSTAAVTPRRTPPTGCLAGACSQDQCQARVAAAGFKIALWQDHSRLLRELAARLVFAHGSLQNFWDRVPNAAGTGKMNPAVGCARPGCYLMIARRK